MSSTTLKGGAQLRLDRYATALRLGQKDPAFAKGLCGRIIRGKSPKDFETLTDDPRRKLVMLVGPDGLQSLLGKSGFEMLVEIGYTPDHIHRKVVDEGCDFKLVVFPEGGPAKLATWDNAVAAVADAYPDVARKLRANLDGLKSTPFAKIESVAGFNFAQIDKIGASDPRFMTIERFRTSVGTLVEARAFLYFTVHLRELYSGDGYTYTSGGDRGLMEYIVPNRPIADLGENIIIPLTVEIPSTKGAATMARKSTQSYELLLPKFYDPKQVGEWKWNVNFPARFGDAVTWREKNKIESAAKDRLRIALMPIDCQLTFCHPDFELYVGGRSGTGAIDDTRRLCEFVYRNLRVITQICPTMDTHLPFQIFHPAFLVNEKGEHPDPRYPLPISEEDVRTGKWRVDPRAAYAVTGKPGTYAGLQEHFAHYVKTLSQGGKLSLMVWPFHAMLSSKGHALMPALEEAVFFHAITRGTQPDFQIKGGNPLTENYSVLRPEVLTFPNGNALASKNAKFIKALLDNDAVVIAGQAKSHCVAWTIADLLDEIMAQDPELVKKVYLLEDCTSPVVVSGIVDFTQQADDAFARFAAAGMNVVKSTTPIAEWPGIDAAALEL